MHIDWKILLTALGLAFILEGLPYFLAAEKMPSVLRALSERKPAELRTLGLTAMPPFLGSPAEREALAVHIAQDINGRTPQPEKPVAIEPAEVAIPAFDADKAGYVLLAWNSLGVVALAGCDGSFSLAVPGNTVQAVLIKRDVMAFLGQTVRHSPQPMHTDLSMAAFLSDSVAALTGQTRTHSPQPMHFFGSTWKRMQCWSRLPARGAQPMALILARVSLMIGSSATAATRSSMRALISKWLLMASGSVGRVCSSSQTPRIMATWFPQGQSAAACRAHDLS